MSPGQTTVSLLPATIESMEFDLRISEDGLGITRPDLSVELILGPSTNAWNIEPPAPGNQEPYNLQNADLDHSKGRILANGNREAIDTDNLRSLMAGGAELAELEAELKN